jgi:hypothetical protein
MDRLWTFEGDLYRQDKGYKTPLRKNYDRHHATIITTMDLRATLRAGRFTWPGCYPLFFIASDGGALCFDCVRKDYRRVSNSIRHKMHDGWKVEACDVNYEDNELVCDHCSKQIESAYGGDDD